MVTKVRRVLLGAACAIAVAWLALPFFARQALVAHPLGSTPAPYGFVELVPDTPGPHPLVVLLHGRGEVGDGTDPGAIVEVLTPLHEAALARELGGASPLVDEGAVVVAPQSSSDWEVPRLDALLDYLLATREIDRDRVYFTGLSMGGAGVATYAALHADRLAAVMPVCGAWYALPRTTAPLRALPVRAFHGALDDIVPPRATSEWVAAISVHRGGDGVDPLASYPDTDATAVFDGQRFVWRAGTFAEPEEALTLTELASAGHRVWPEVYADPATWRWLFAQRRDPAR